MMNALSYLFLGHGFLDLKQSGFIKVGYRNLGPFVREKHIFHKLVNGIFLGVVCQFELSCIYVPSGHRHSQHHIHATYQAVFLDIVVKVVFARLQRQKMHMKVSLFLRLDSYHNLVSDGIPVL